MKKILALTASSFSYLAFVSPAIAQAATEVNPCPTGGTFDPLCNLSAGNFGPFVGTAINVAFVLAVIIAVVYLIYGGIKWIMSRGEKEKVEEARSHIVAAVVGLIIVFLSFFIINIILQIFTGNGNLKGGLTLPSLSGLTPAPN